MTVLEISVHDLAALGAGARIVDVRELNEWELGHIGHAVLVPLATIPEQLGVFDGDPTYVVCRSGARSANACRFLEEQGIAAVNVAGGMLAWADAGLDVESGPASGITRG